MNPHRIQNKATVFKTARLILRYLINDSTNLVVQLNTWTNTSRTTLNGGMPGVGHLKEHFIWCVKISSLACVPTVNNREAEHYGTKTAASHQGANQMLLLHLLWCHPSLICTMMFNLDRSRRSFLKNDLSHSAESGYFPAAVRRDGIRSSGRRHSVRDCMWIFTVHFERSTADLCSASSSIHTQLIKRSNTGY